MTTDSKIEWTDHTFNPWLGCTKISAACDNCYAAALAKRYGWPPYRAGEPRRRTAPASWKTPLRWQRQARANGARPRVFPSLCDPFDAEVDPAWRDDFFRDVVEATPDLDWLILTKRPHLAGRYFRTRPVPHNVALGVTAENQPMADLRIPQLLAIDGVRLRFVSIEPALGLILLRPDWLTGDRRVDWIIAGGESGPGARPLHPDWIRALRDQCLLARVAFFFKQWGEYAPCELLAGKRLPLSVVFLDGRHATGRQVLDKPHDRHAEIIARAGKAAAGAMLDGREWRQLPPQLQAAP